MKVKTAKVLGILISVLVLFASCGQMSDGGDTEITVSLPYVDGTNSRAIDPGKKGDLINETKWYRVHMNDMVLEGSGGNFSAYFPVGLKLEIYVECLNSNRDVIVRTITKSITVGSRENNVNFNLMTEGNEIIPPAPAQGQVTYNGNGANGGITPNDPASHDVGSDVSLQAGEPTRSGYTFAGWTADKELKYTNAGQEQTIPAGTEFASTSSNTSTNIKTDTFKMPEGGVVFTAKWTPIQYTVNFNGDGAQGSENSINFTVEDTGKTFPASTGFNKQGNTLQHWATGSGGKSISLEYIIDQLKLGNTNSVLTIGNNNDITVYAVWSELSTLYASSAGSDANIGTSASPLTITKAFEMASASSSPKTIEVQSNITGVAVEQTGGNITLNLSGNTLTGDGTNPVIKISVGSLTLEDSGGGKITGGNKGVYVQNGMTFTMNGGEISDNTATGSGGGVYVGATGTFTLENGRITNNFASQNSGGVHAEGTFTMNGGEVTNNKCGGYGGGVNIASRFNGTGGTMSGNKAHYDRNQPDGGTTAKDSDWHGGGSYWYSGSSPNSSSWIEEQ